MKTIKKVFSILIAYSTLLGQVAYANGQEAMINNAIDQIELQATTQPGQEEIEAVTAAVINDLIEQGVSTDDILTQFEARILSQENKAEYDTMIEALEAQGADDITKAQEMLKFVNNTHHTGSSFQGAAEVVGTVLALAFSFYIIKFIIEEIEEDRDRRRHGGGVHIH